MTGKSRFKLCHGYLNSLHKQETEGANENWKPGLSLEQIFFPFTEYSRITPILTQFVFHLQPNAKKILNRQCLIKIKNKKTPPFGQRKRDFFLPLTSKLFPSVKVENCNSAKSN